MLQLLKRENKERRRQKNSRKIERNQITPRIKLLSGSTASRLSYSIAKGPVLERTLKGET
jgi:hypothetical protein